MLRFDVQGLDEMIKRLEDLQTPSGLEKIFADHICELVPEASSVRHSFKFTHLPNDKINLSIDCVTPELYDKITAALQK